MNLFANHDRAASREVPSMTRVGKSGIAWLLALGACAAAVAQHPGPQKISLADSSGRPAADNLFAHAVDVFLSSPGATCAAAGLPDGRYYLQVTDPSGKYLLSTDPPQARLITVRGGLFVQAGLTAHAIAPASVGCRSSLLAVAPIRETSKFGGIYKVWVTPADDFEGDPSVPDNVCGPGCFHGFDTAQSLTVNFGLKSSRACPTQCASGAVYADANGNGRRDAGESGLAGVMVDVTDDSGIAMSAVTGPDGSWMVCGLTAQHYTVRETVPAGYTQTGPAGSGRPARGVSFSGFAYSIDVCTDDIEGLDFGNQSFPASISGVKFNDINGNGIEDPGEAGVAGVTIMLTDSAQNVTTAVTDSSGHFSFENLPAGSYTLSEALPSGTVQTSPGGGGYIGVVLMPGEQFTGALFGNQVESASGSIAGTGFLDVNGNGIREPDEPGFPGVVVELAGSASATMTTDENGNFSFTGLAAGSYTLSEVVPPGYQQTVPASGSYAIVLAGGQAAGGYLFGNAPTAAATGTISGVKFEDDNGNGLRDAGEPGIAGVTITLAGGGRVLSTVTGADGSFSFTGLAAGAYTISETVPPGYVQTAPGGSGTIEIDLAAGQVSSNNLFGNMPLPVGSIEGVKFFDLNGNGVFDPGVDTYIVGVTIELLDTNGNIVATTTSGRFGAFSFANIPPGTYTMREIEPFGFGQTAPPNHGTFTVTVEPGKTASGFAFGNRCTFINPVLP
jgi:SdrD B-like domain